MTDTPDPDLILIDGSSYLYRAFYALPPLNNPAGQPTGAIFGVMNMIRKLIGDYPNAQVAVVFDPKGKTFRDTLYADYKAHRPPMPDDLASQVDPLMQLIRAQGIPLIIIDGVEADDVIATIALQNKARQQHTLISTGDKDIAQIVCDEIKLINTMTNTLLSYQGVCDKFGVQPEQIIDYLALIGDSSDNIPGIPKVGPKTAVKWLETYHNIDTLIENADAIKGKVGENLRSNLQQLALSRQLVTLKTDVKLPFALDALVAQPPDKPALIALLQRLAFKSWLAQVLGEQEAEMPTQPNPKAAYETVLTEKQLNTWIIKLKQAKTFALDTETTSLCPHRATLVGISIATQAQEGAYIPVAHDYADAPTQLSLVMVLDALRPLLADTSLTVIGQNLKYDINVLAQYDITLGAQLFDTMLESYVLNPSANRHDMDSLSLKHLGHKTTTFEDVAGKGVKQKTFNQIDIETASHYAAEDADITLQLHQKLWPEIQSDDALSAIFRKCEMPLMPVLARIEQNGVLIDADQLQQQSAHMQTQITHCEQQAFALVGHEFNIASTQQLQHVLFEELGLPVLAKTPKGVPSTAESVLQELAHDYPLPKLILEFRSLSKLKSTYTDKLPTQINPRTGRVHTSYHQAVTSTGRLSSSDPNLQNIPVRTEAGRRIRAAFIAREGFKVVALDYSQIELRIMAHITDDPGLNKAFANGWDVHTATASEVFNVAIDAVTPLQRRQAKAINFGLLYGMSAFGLAKQLDISRDDASDYINTYFARYPRVRDYMDSIRQRAHEHGYVQTLFGRRLYLPEINSRNGMRRKAAERAAINAPLQGSAADIIKRAMLSIDAFLTTCPHDAMMIMQVHDELVFELRDTKVDELVPEIATRMQQAADLRVKLEAHAGIGDNWDEAH